MKKPKSIERIEMMRKGEKIKCPKCESGFISAVGDPKIAYYFKCDKCSVSIVQTQKIDIETVLSK